MLLKQIKVINTRIKTTSLKNWTYLTLDLECGAVLHIQTSLVLGRQTV